MMNNRQFFNFLNPWGQNEPAFPWGPGGGTNQAAQGGGPPMVPPPNFVPEAKQVQTYAVDSGAIRGCLYRFTYVWLNRDGFWFYPIFVGRRSVSGYRWHGFRWVYVGISLDHIQSFQCY